MALSTTSRRQTLCTDDGRDIVPSQLPFFPVDSSSSMRTGKGVRDGRRDVGDVHLTDGRKKVRPLPRIPIPPTPKSAPPPTPNQNRDDASASMRPLPCLPGLGSGGLSVLVTPATPLPPPTPIQSRRTDAHLAPPSRRGPSRHASLSLKIETIPDAADIGAFGRRSQSPRTPTLPEPPSPRTAQRIRNSKLRRQLGESVQFVLDFGLDRLSDEGVNRDILARLRGKNEDALVGYPLAFETVLDLQPELDSDTSSDTSSESDEGERDMDYFCPLPPRTSRKWIRERGQQRWTEDNFPQILQDLRNL